MLEVYFFFLSCRLSSVPQGKSGRLFHTRSAFCHRGLGPTEFLFADWVFTTFTSCHDFFRPIGCEEVRTVPSMTELKGQAAPLRKPLSGCHWLWIPAVCTFHHFYDKEGVDCGVCRILLEKPVSLGYFISDHFSRLRRHCSLFQLAVDFPQADNNMSSFEPNYSHLEVSRSQARAFVFFKVAASLRPPACSCLFRNAAPTRSSQSWASLPPASFLELRNGSSDASYRRHLHTRFD